MNQNTLIPLAILGAGALVAGAVFFTMRDAVPENPEATFSSGGSEIRPLSDASHVRGNPDAPVILVEYSDFECPFCQRFHSTLEAVMETHGRDGNLAWAYRHFPLQQLHPTAAEVSRASECVAELGGNDAFWSFADEYYETTPQGSALELSLMETFAENAGVDKATFNECFSSTRHQEIVDADFQEAVAAGGNGTPFSVLIFDGKLTREMEDFFKELNAQFGDELFKKLSDTQVSMSGALSDQVISLIVETYLENK